MNDSFFDEIILYCLKKLNGERTIYGIYHLLQGKKSSQTIQDAHLFQLTAFFHTYPHVKRTDLEETAKKFLQLQFIAEKMNGHYILTPIGEKYLQESLASRPIPAFLNGWKYERMAEVFWERLSLAVQVISYLQNHESKYIPIQRKPETLSWMKKFFKQTKLKRESLAEQLYNELTACLESEETMDPALLIIRLSGYRTVGLTEEQAAREMEMEATYYHYQFLNIVHYVVQQIEDGHQRYPILSSFIDPAEKGSLTHSTAKTFSLLKQGFSIRHIMEIRRLKQSTIEDHLVELALHMKDFSIDSYVSTEKLDKILKAVKLTKTKQLKEIRKHVPDAEYVEIRLVLAKYGDDI